VTQENQVQPLAWRAIERFALVVGLFADLVALLSIGGGPSSGLPSLPFALTPERIWMMTAFGAIGTVYLVSRVTGQNLFIPERRQMGGVELFLLMGPWILLAGSATGLF
jgi:hypothetical protein